MHSVRFERLVWSCVCVGALLIAMTERAVAQGGAEAASTNAATAFESRLQEFRDAGRKTAGSAAVSGLTIVRDIGTLRLDRGTLYRMGPVGGRTVALGFEGQGRFTFAPTHPVERDRLAKEYKASPLEVAVKGAVLVFADSTMREIERTVSFAAGRGSSADLEGRFEQMMEYLGDPESKEIDPDVMTDLLNGTESGLFYAHITRDGGGPLMFMHNPNLVEGVQLLARARRTGWTRVTDVVSQYRRIADSAVVYRGDRWRGPRVSHYAVHTSLPRNNAGDVRFSAAARIELTAEHGTGPWVPLVLYRALELDSVRAADGSPLVAHKGKDASELWLHLGRPLEPGEKRTVTAYYHGDLIERYGDFFFIKSSAAWYPRTLDAAPATFDLTFDSPQSFGLASVGERTDSSDLPDRMIRSRWQTAGPAVHASFNLGRFEAFQPPATGAPPVTVLYSEAGHRALAREGAPKAFDKQRVGDDIVKALKFFQHVYGEPPSKSFYATEIPYFHGQAFPGLVHLSFVTFMGAMPDGGDESFRAHEVAHQWWGLAVENASYRDRWLSEGLAEFSGLWYLQTVRGDSKRYFHFLNESKPSILLRRNEREPIWLGHRAASASDGSDDFVLTYQKGAWVTHMLRVMMLDLRTMKEDRFTGAMREFYATYRGQRASTEDFKKVMEKYVGVDLKWFFDQWVYGSEIPTYGVAHTAVRGPDGKWRVKLRVAQSNVPETFQMYVPVSVDLGGGQWARTRVLVKGRQMEVELPFALDAQPKGVRFNDMDGVLAEVKTSGW